MFENVVGAPDPEARRREATSVGLTTALLAGLIGFQMGLAAFLVSEITAPEGDTVQLVLIETVDATEPEAAPAPPPPPKGGGTSETTPDDEPPDDVQPLDPEPEPEVAESKEAAGAGTADGDPDGEEGGVTGGERHGRVGGTGEGDGDGTGDGVRAFHHSELKRTRVVDPSYPRAAADLGLGRVSCRVHVFLAETGVPYDAIVESCPTPFHEETKRAMLRSRWVPPRMNGEPVKARTVLLVHYQLR